MHNKKNDRQYYTNEKCNFIKGNTYDIRPSDHYSGISNR